MKTMEKEKVKERQSKENEKNHKLSELTRKEKGQRGKRVCVERERQGRGSLS